MHVDNYTFGHIVVDGQHYDNDVIIGQTEILSPWSRKEGHSLHKQDLKSILENPKLEELYIGSGYSGVMDVPSELIRDLERNGIRVSVGITREVVGLFNQSACINKAAALHVTC